MTGYLYRGDPWLAVVNARIMAEREPGSKGVTGLPGHGTEAGARRHWRRGEKACGACAPAATAAAKRRKGARKDES